MGISSVVVFVLSALLPAPIQTPGRFDTTEFMLDTTSSGYINWAQWDPAVAFNGENYLVVWKDSTHRILCARVSQVGTVLDPAGEIVYNAGSWHAPDVASDGDGFLAVWDGDWGHRIIAALVSRDGVAADTITVSYSAKQCYSPRVAFNGTDYLVTWYDSRNSDQWNIYACRVNPSGVALDTQGIKVTTPTSIWHDNQFPSVASDGQSFLVTWETNVTGPWAARFSRITGDGIVLDTGGIMLNQEGDVARSPAVAFDGTNYLVTWSGGAGLADIEGKRVSPAGVVLDRTPISVSSAPDVQEQPQTVFDGTNYVVVWQDQRNGSYDIYGARVSPGGTVLDPSGFPVSLAENGQEVPGLAAGLSNLLVAWQDKRYDIARPHIFATLLDSTGAVQGSEIPIPDLVRRYSIQTNPASAYDGVNYFVVWQDSQPGTTKWDIMGARVAPTGEVLDVPPMRVSTGTDYQWNPAVAFGGSEYFVTWQDRRFGASAGWAIYGARVTTSGTVLDTGGILIRRRQGYNIVTPSVSSDGVNFLALWSEGWTYGRFINQAGQLLDSTPFPVTTTPDAKSYPCATFGMGSYMVAWADNRESPHYTVIFATRLNEFGGRRDTGDLRLSQVIMALPAVTSDGTNFLVTWQDEFDHGVYAGRVSGNGQVLSPTSYPVCTGPGRMWYPSVCFDGANYIVAWQDDRNGGLDIYGAKMNRSLTAHDTFPICTKPKDQTQPAIVHGPGSQVLVAFSGVVDSVGGNPASGQRIWGKLVDLPGPVSPTPLWPPNDHIFNASPVWVMVDTARPDIDTFDFCVRYLEGGDTVWRQALVTPTCTIPDSVLVSGGTHVWQCRGHAQSGWSRFCDEHRFVVDFQSPALLQPCPASPRPALSLPSISSRRDRALTIVVTGTRTGAELELFDVLGRRVRRFSVTRDGSLTWDLRNEAGQRVGSGSYFARFICNQEAIIRKFLLTD